MGIKPGPKRTAKSTGKPDKRQRIIIKLRGISHRLNLINTRKVINKGIIALNKTLNRTAKAALLFPLLRFACPVSLALGLLNRKYNKVYMRNIFCLIVVSFLVQIAGYAHASEKYWVSLLRSDGVLVPFSMYEKGKWQSTWPEPDGNNYGLKIKELSDIPKKWLGNFSQIPRQWFLTELNGSTKNITVTQPAKYSSHCEGNWGLKTDYPTVVSEYGHTPKVGLALNTNLTVFPAINGLTLPLDSPIINFVKKHFGQAETVAIEKKQKEHPLDGNRLASSGHPINPEERNKVSTSIVDLNQITIRPNKESIYYFAAWKKYKKPKDFSDSSCEGISYFTGFISHQTGGDFTFIEQSLYITDCDMKYVVKSAPLGVVRIENQLFLVKENTYYESEAYFIELIKNNQMIEVFNSYGGGC